MISVKMAQYVWSLNNNVCFFSPEMSANLIGYRFDSANQHFSNDALMYGQPIKEYKSYIESLVSFKQTSFNVITLEDFANEVTVPKLKQACLKLKSRILFIDGFDYITDCRAHKYDSREDRYGHVAQDLLTVSKELHIPVVAVIQANRKATDDKEKELGTENITGADKIGASCTRLLTLVASGPAIEIGISKNRYGRTGKTAKTLYQWDIDRSKFFFIPTIEDVKQNSEDSKKELEKTKQQFVNVF